MRKRNYSHKKGGANKTTPLSLFGVLAEKRAVLCEALPYSQHYSQRGRAYPPQHPGEPYETYRPRALKNIAQRHDLFEAIAFVDPETVEAILFEEPTLIHTTYKGMTPLVYAMHVISQGVEEEAEQEMIHVLDRLIQYGAELNEDKGRMRSVLLQGVESPIIKGWLNGK